MICIYHNDMDGKASGAIVYNFHKDKKEEVDCIPINYNEPSPFDKIKAGEKVYVVDYSFEPEEFKKLLAITEDVVWIDHHVSSIKKFEGTDVEKLPGVRLVGESGCELTWKFFYGDRIPTVIRMLGRYDVWDFELYGKKTLNSLQEYCKTVNTKPSSDIWKDWLEVSYSPRRELAEGEAFLSYRDSVWSDSLEKWGFEADFEGYFCIVCNTSSFTSEFFSSVSDKDYDILIPCAFDGSKWVVSLYTLSSDIDCSKIAVKYGGGGHKKASGFVIKELPFKKKEK